MQRITVVCPDRKGLIAEVTEVLSRQGMNISEVQAGAVGTDAVLHLSVDEDANRAIAALTRSGFQAIAQEVVAVHVPDEAGALARIARKLTEAGLNIRSVSMLSRSGGQCIVAIDTDNNPLARNLLSSLSI